MASEPKLRPESRPAKAGFVLLFALALGALALTTGILLFAGLGRGGGKVPSFLSNQLGGRADAPTIRPRGLRAMVDQDGLRVRLGSTDVHVSADSRGSSWQMHEQGAVRKTPFGAEAVVLRAAGVEDYLTVEKHQGVRTWRWRLGRNIDPTLSLGLVILKPRGGGRSTMIEPPRVLDRTGADVTPHGLRWTLARRAGVSWLELELDDRALPTPYVIDPAVTNVTFSAPLQVGGYTETWTVGMRVTSALASGNSIYARFSSGFNLSSITTASIGLGAGFTNCNVASIVSNAAPLLRFALGNSGGTCAVTAGAAITFTAAGIVNDVAGTYTANTNTGGTALFNARTSPDNTTVADSAGSEVLVAPPTKLVITSVAAPNTSSFNVTVQAQDATNAPRPVATNVTFTLSKASGTGVLGGTVTGTINAGTNSFTVTGVSYSIAQGGVSLTATQTGGTPALTAGTSGLFTVALGAPTKLVVATPVANTSSFSVTVTSTDPWGTASNVTTASNVSLSVASGTGALGGTTTGTIAAGANSATINGVRYSIAQAGVSFTATQTSGTPALAVGTSATFTVTLGAPTKLVVATPAANTTSFSVTVTSTDPWGTASNVTTASNVSLSVASGTGSLGGTTTGTIAAGANNTTINGARYSVAEAGVSFTATQTSGTPALAAGTSATFTVTLGAPTKLVVATPTANTSSFSVTVTSTDPWGTASNVTTASNVSLSVASGTGSLGGTTTGTIAAGANNTTINGVSYSIAQAGVSLTATQTSGTPALAAGTSATFTVTLGAPTKLVVATPTANTSSFSVTVTSTDPWGTASNVTTASNVSLSVASGTGSVGGTTTGTIAAGANNTTINGVSYSIAQAGVSLTATQTSGTPALAAGTSATFTVTLGGPTKLVVTTPVANTTSFSVTVTSTDPWGTASNVTTASNVSLSVASGTGSLGGTTTGTIAAGANNTTINGARYSVAEAGVSFTATQTSGTPALAAGTSATFTVTLGAPTKLVVATPTANTSSFSVTVTSTDPWGTASNVTTASNVSLSVASGTGSLGGTTTGTIAAGANNTTINGVSYSIAQAGVSLTATQTSGTPALAAGTSATFTVTLGAPTKLVVATPTANTSSFSVTVTSTDPWGTASNVTTASNVSLSVASGTGSVGGTTTGTIAAGANNTTINGVSYSIAQAGVSFTATQTSGTPALAAGTSATFTVTLGNPTKLAITAVPGANVAAGTSFSVTIKSQDPWGTASNVVASTGLSLAIVAGSGTLSGNSGTITAGTNTLTLSSVQYTKAEVINLTASRTSGDVLATSAQSAAITVVAGALSSFVLSGTPASVTAGTAASVTATAQDAFGNTVLGYTGTVHFTSSDPAASLPADTAFVPADNGVHVFSSAYTLKTAGSRTVSVNDTVTPAITGTSTGITVNPAAASQLVVTTQPGGATAGSAFGTQPVVKVEDIYGNVVTTDSSNVTATINSGTGSLQGTATVAASSGVATFTNLRIDTAGAKTLHFADGALTNVNSGSFTVNFAAASQLVATTDPAGATAGSAFATQPVVKVEDAYGNVVTSDSSNVTATINSGTGSLQGTATIAASSGIASFTNLRIDTSGAKTLHFADGALTNVNSGSFTVSPAAATQLVATTDPAGATAGSAFATQPVVKVEDAYGNIVTSDSSNVTATINSGTGSLQGTATIAASSGVASFTNLRIDTSGAKTLHFADGALTNVNSGSFTVNFAAASQLVVTTDPAGATAGSAFATQPVVKVEDAYGNIVTSDSSNVTATINSGTGSLQGTATVAASAGIATFTNLRIDSAGAKTLHFADGALSTANSGSFTVNFAAASQLVATTDPAGATAGSAFATQPVVKVEDAYGNVVTSDSSNVTATINSGSGSLQGTATIAASSGVASFTNLRIDTSGAKTLHFADGALTTANTGSFTVNAAAATQLSLTGTPASLTAGATGSVTVTALDAYGNTATSYLGTVSFTSSDPAASLPANYPFTGGDAGVHTFSNAYTLKTAGSRTLTATDTLTGTINGTSTGITVNPAAASQLVVTTQPGGATAGSAFASQPVVKVEDIYGNVVTSDSSNVTATINSGTGSLQGTATIAASAGVATFINLRIDTAGAKTLHFADGALTTANTGSFTVNFAAATQLVVTTDPAGATAGSPFATQPVVKVEDAYGNVVTSDSSNVTATINSGTGSLQGTTTLAASAGVATFTNLRIDTSGAKTLHFADGALTTANTGSFTVNFAAASQLVATTDPAGATAGSAFTTQPVVKVEDAYGNVVTSDSSNVTATINSGTGTLQGTTTLAASSGVATFTNLRIDTAGAKTLHFADGALTTANTGSFTVNFAAATQLVATTDPAGATAGSPFTTQPVVKVEDAYGNIVTSDSSNVTATINSGTGSLQGTTTLAASAGIATFTNLRIDTSGAKTLHFADGALTTANTGSFTVNFAAATQLVVTTDPAGATAGAAFGTQPVVKVEDIYGNVVTTDSSNVTATINSGTGSLQGTATVAASSGVATFTNLRIDTSGAKTLHFADGALTTANTGSFTVNFAAASQLVVTTDPAGATAGSAFTTQPVVKVEDAYGNIVTSDSSNVTATINTGTGSLQGTATIAASSGVATFTNLRIDTAGAKTLHFADGALTNVNSGSFTVSPAAATQLVATTDPAGATAGSAFATQPVVKVEDAYGNVVTSDSSNVTATINSGTGSLQGTATIAASSGVASFTNLRIDTAGAKTLHFADGALTTANSGSFTVNFAAASQLVVTTDPAGATAGSAFATQPVVKVEDAYGNIVTSDSSNVTATINSGTGSLQGTATVAASAGIATFTNLRIDSAGAKTLHFADGALSTANSGSFTVNFAAASQLVATTDPAGATAGSAFATQPVVKVEDAYGNVVTSDSSNVTATINSGSGSLQGTATIAASSGVASFTNLRIDTSGAKTLHFADGALTTVNSGSFTVSPAAATQLSLTGTPASLTAGATGSVTVTALDAYGNTATSYLGTVSFTSSDPAASLPANYPFTGGDAGVHTFSNAYTLKTAGSRTLTATDTLTGTINGTSTGITVNPAPADHFTWSGVPASAVAGSAFSMTLTAQDVYGNTASGYTGTVSFTSTDGAATLPSNYTYTTSGGSPDNGVHLFGVTLATVAGGAKTITATDNSLPAGNRSLATSGITVTHAAVMSFAITDASGGSVAAGNTDQLTITAKDSYGNVATGYTGDHDLTFAGGATSPNATAPTVTDKTGATVAFGGSTTITFANGVSSAGALMTLTKAAAQTITASASSPSVTTPTGLSMSVSPATAAGYGLADAAGGSVAAGQNDQLTITADDAYGNVATGYAGDHDLTFAGGLSSPNATAPTVTNKTGAPVAFGSATTVTFTSGVSTAGGAMKLTKAVAQSITASATSPTLATATPLAAAVSPAAADRLVVSNAPASITAGNPAPLRVTATDPYGNTATTYTGTLTFSSDDPAAALPTNYTYTGGDAGVHDFSGAATATLKTTGNRHVTVTDSGLANPNATSSAIAVNPASADHFAWSGTPAGATAGAPFSITLRAEDVYGNVAAGYAGTVNFTSSDAQAVLPAAYTFTPGDAGVHAFSSGFTLKTVAGGAKTITATDNSLPAGNRSLATSGIAVTPAAASQLVVTTDPAGATAGSAFATQPVVKVEDAYGNVVTSDSSNVTATINSGTGSLQGTTTLAASSGVATFTNLRIDTAGAKTLHFADGALTIANSGSFTVNFAAASQLVVTTDPAGATAGSAFATQPVVKVEDAYGNVVTSDSSNVTATINSGTGSLQGSATIAASSGVATFTNLRIDTAGAKTLHFADGALSTANSGSFTVNFAAASQLVATTDPAGATAGSAFATQPVVEVEDAYGNVVTSDSSNVTATINSGTGSLQGTATIAASSGVATFTNLRIDTAGAKTLHFADGALTNVNSGSFTVSPAAATQLVATTDPAGATAGAAFATQPVVKVEDAYGNVVTTDSSNVTATINSGTGSLQGTATIAASSGVATFTNLRIDTSGAKTLHFADGALTNTNSGSFTVSPAAATQLVVTTDPASATAGSAFATQPVVKVEDAYGNVVTTDSSNVTATINSGSGSLQGTATIAASSGVASFTNLRIDTSGAKTLHFADGALTTANSGSFTVSPAAATQLVVTTDPAGATAGAAFATQPVVKVEDAYGNVVTTDSSNVTATINSGSGSLQGTATIAASSGVATFTNLRIDTAGAKTLHFADGALTNVNSGSFTVSPAAATQLVVTTDPAGATAGSAFATQPVVKVEDAYGNVVTTDSSNVTATINSGTGSLQGTATIAASSGVATFTNLRIDTAGAKTLHFADGALTTANSGSFTVNFAAASQLVVTTDPAGATAGSAFATQPVVKVEDAYGNIVTSDSSNVTATINSGTGSLQGTATVAASAGIATFTNLRIDSAGAKTLHFADGALSTANSGSFTVNFAAASQLVATTDPAGATAGSAFATQPVVKVEDAYGNVVTSDSSNVTATINSGSGSLQGTATIAASSGVASFTNLRIDTSGAKTLHFADGALTTANTGSFTVNFAAASQLVATTDPAGATAGSAFATQPVVKVEDAYGNIVTTDSSNVTATINSGTGTLQGTATIAASSGIASFTNLRIDTSGAKTLHFADGALTTANTGSFTVNFAAATQLVATTDPAGATAGSAFATQPVVEIRDAYGNLVTNDTSSVIATIVGGGSLQGTTTRSAVSGVATFTDLRIDSAGSKQLHFADGSLTAADSGSFGVANASVDAAASSLAAFPSSVIADGVAGSTVTVTLRDAYSNPVAGKSVSLARVGGGFSTISGSPAVTNASGVATFSAKDTVTESQTYRATDDTDAVTVTQTAGVTFTAGNASLVNSTLTASPTSIVANGASTSTVTVRLKDPLGNDVTSSGGTVVVSGSVGGTVGATTDNGDGTYTATVTAPTTVGTDAIGATLNGSALTATASVTFVPGPLSAFVVSAASPQTAGSPFDVTVTATDASGNTVTGYTGTVHFTSTDGQAVLPADYTFVAGDNGVHAFTNGVTLKTAGSRTVSVADGSNNGTSSSISVSPALPNAGTSSVSASPTSVSTDGATSTVTVTLRDVHGNPVPGKSVSLAPTAATSAANPDTPQTTSAAGVATFVISDTVAESTTWRATDVTDGVIVTQTASIGFTSGAVDHLTITPTSSTITAGASETYVVKAWDVHSNLIGDVSGASGFSIVPTPAGTSCSGATCTTVTAGSYTVIASYSGKSVNATLTANSASASTTTSTVTAGQPTLQVGGNTTTITVQLKDGFGNPLTSTGGAVVVSATYGTVGATTDNGDGTYTATLASPNLVNIDSVTATLNGSLLASSAPVTYTPAPATHLGLVPSGTTPTAGSAFTVDVTALDQFGNTDAGYAGTVSFTSTDGSATLPAATTLSSGQKTVSVTLATAGPQTVSANGPGVSGSTPTITVAAGSVSASESTISANPNSVVHDGVTQTVVTVTLEDALGNRVGNKTIALSATGSASIADSPQTADANGVAVFHATDTAVESVSFSAVGDGISLTQTAAVNFTSGALDHIVLTPASATISAGATQAYHIEGYDSSNLDLGDFTGSSTLKLDGVDCGGSTCGAIVAGSHAVTATNSGKTDSATLSVTPASASPATSTVSASSPVSVSIPGSGGTTVTVRLKDAFGNPLAAGGDPVTIQSILGSLTPVVDHGDGTYTATLTSTLVGVASVTARIGISTIATGTTVTFIPGAAASLTLSGPGSATAGSSFPVSSTVKDAFGNVAIGYTGTLHFTSSDGQAVLPADYTFTAGDAGTHTFSATLKTAGSGTISASDGPLSDSTGSVAVAAAAVSATASTVSASPGTVLADGAATTTVTVTLKDAYGNPVQGKSVALNCPCGSSSPSAPSGSSDSSGRVSFSVTDLTVENVTFAAIDNTDALTLTDTASVSFISGGLASITISPTTQTKPAGQSQTYQVEGYDGVGHDLGDKTSLATFSIGPDGSCPGSGPSCSATAPGAHTVTATVSGHSAVSNLTVSAGTLDHIAITPVNATITLGASKTYGATGYDAYNNSLGTVTGATTFTISPDGSCAGATCTPAAAGDHTITGTDGASTDSTTLHVDPAGPGPDTTPPSVTSINGGGSTITVHFDEPLTNVALPASDFTVTVNGAADSVTSADAQGSVVVVHVATSLSSGDTVLITYAGTSIKDVAGNAAAGFGPSAVTVSGGGGSTVDSDTSSASASPTSVPADGTTTSTITVTLKDSSGTPVAGKTVSLTPSGGSSTISAASGPSDASGQVTFTVNDASAESVTYSARDTTDGVDVTQTATVTFTGATDTTGPVALAASGSVSGSTILISFDEPLAGSLAAANFTVNGSVTGSVTVNGASVTPGDTTVSVSLATPLSDTEAYTVTYGAPFTLTDNAPALNPASGFTLNVNTGGGGGGGGGGGDDPQYSPPPPPPPPPASFLSVSPADNSVVHELTQIEFQASITVHWVNITVNPDGGGDAITLPDGWGTPYDVPFAPTAEGAYTLNADMIDGRYGSFVPVHVTSHFYFGTPPPPPPTAPVVSDGNGGPGLAGNVVTSDGGAAVEWDGSTFADGVTVTVRPVGDGIGPANGGRAVEVTAVRTSDGSRVTSLAGVLDIHFPNAPADAIPASSEDNVVWAPLASLSSHDLPSGVPAGFYRDASGTVHILTTHLTYFGLLRAASSKLAFQVVGTVRYVVGAQKTIAVRLQSTRAVKVTASLFSPRGRRLTVWRLQAKAGTSIVKLRWPKKAEVVGVYTVTVGAAAGSQTSSRAIHVQVVKPGARVLKRPVEVVVSSQTMQGLAPGLSSVRVVTTAGEDTFAAAGTLGANVGVIVLDVDQYGLAMLRDLHTLFPSVRLVALSSSSKTLARARSLGATVALPASASTPQIAMLVDRLALLAR